jgi:hypothetical protein
LLEAQKNKREELDLAFAFGVKLVNGQPDMERVKEMQEALQSVDVTNKKKDWLKAI